MVCHWPPWRAGCLVVSCWVGCAYSAVARLARRPGGAAAEVESACKGRVGADAFYRLLRYVCRGGVGCFSRG